MVLNGVRINKSNKRKNEKRLWETAGKVIRIVYSTDWSKVKCNHGQQTFEKKQTGEAKFNEKRRRLGSDSRNGKQNYKQSKNVELTLQRNKISVLTA